jgi:hypothetical protein
MKKFLKYFAIFIIIALVGMQFVRPEKITTSDIGPDHLTKKVQVPANVESILKRSCYDCHSNHTVWPWYSNIAPVSWLVAGDVNDGRKKMNFSEWGKLSATKQEKKLTDICDEVTEGGMPLPKYLIIHKDAALTQADKDVLCNWVKSLGAGTDESDKKDEKKDK